MPHLKEPPVAASGLVCYEEEQDVHSEHRKLSTCPPDPRFQQQNKTKWCYRMFIDFQRCSYLLGLENKQCKMFLKCYKCLCPKEWVNNWNEQIENGTFPRDLKKDIGH